MEEDKHNQLFQDKLLANKDDQINGYKLLSSLSSSVTGTTYKCSKNGQIYVLKLIPKENAKIAKRQIHALQKLKTCDYFVKIVDSFDQQGKLCFITEFFEGEGLISFIRRQKDKKIDLQQSLIIFRYILSAVLEMHKENILHRNIKLENVMISQEGIPKLCGFGLSRELDADDMTWSICGTPSYLSPEILLSQIYNYKSDIWSLGVLLFALVTGQLPFGSHTSKRNQYKHISQVCYPQFSFQLVKKGLKYPEKCEFQDQSKQWEQLFQGFFEINLSDRISYSGIVKNELISPVLTVDLPNIYNQDFSALDKMLASRQPDSNISDENSDIQTKTTETTNKQQLQDLEEIDFMLHSKILAQKQEFVTKEDFSKHVSIYKYEMCKYLILTDCLTYFKQPKLYFTLTSNERLLLEFFLEQQILYYSLWLEFILERKQNEFNLINFNVFSESQTYSQITQQVKQDVSVHKIRLEELCQTIQDQKADEKLPKEIQAAILNYVFIDFGSLTYQSKQPDLFKLPSRSIFLSCFQKVYLKSQRFFSLKESVDHLISDGEDTRDKRREISVQEGICFQRFAVRLLVCSLMNRILFNQTCILKDIRFIKNNEFDLATLLTSLTLTTQRQATATISTLFKSYFSQYDLGNIEKAKFI